MALGAETLFTSLKSFIKDPVNDREVRLPSRRLVSGCRWNGVDLADEGGTKVIPQITPHAEDNLRPSMLGAVG